MTKTFLSLEWKKFSRSAAFSKGLVIKILMIFGALYFGGIAIFMGGIGFMQHKIDFVSSQVTIPQLNDEYEYGYDKLTNGLATKEYIGYQYSTEKNRYRFRAGLEFNQGFTRGRRTWDFNENKSGLDKRFDTTIAFKLGIIVPVYTKSKNDEEFFTD